MEPTEPSSADQDIAPPPAIPEPPAPPAQSARRRLMPIVLVVVGAIALAAVIGVAVVASREDAEGPTLVAPSEALMPAPPAGLDARSSKFRVTLEWTPGGGGVSQGYTVYRDSEVVGVIRGQQFPGFVDDELSPGTRYHYVVKASGGDYGAESAGTSIVVTTSPASPAIARLAGIFAVKLHVDSSYGLTGAVGGTAAWRMVPKCSHGPCSSRIIDVNGPMPGIDLQRTAAVYDGTAPGKTGFRCGSLTISGTFHTHLRVTEASSVGGRWRATELSGTLATNMPEALGCRAGGITYDVRATLEEAS